MTNAPAVSFRAVAVGYRGQPVVAGIDLDLARGSTLALVGTNGSGKSTLLKTLAGLLPPCGGVIEVLGGRPGAAPARVGYLGQFHTNSLVLPIRAADVVRMGRFAGRGLLGRLGPSDRAAVAEALERLGVSELADEPLCNLSGGQQQRIFIAQALARRADLLLLDEPAAGLDAAGQELLASAIEAERDRGVAVVAATHDIGDAMRADLVLLVAKRVVAFGSPEEVLTPQNLLDTFGLALREVAGHVIAIDTGHGHGAADPLSRWE